MSGCGYVCPQCEGREVLDDGTSCTWCSQSESNENDNKVPDDVN